MKLPFVSKSRHDRELADVREQSAAWQRLYDTERRRFEEKLAEAERWEAWYHATEQHLSKLMSHYETVLDKYHALRTQGANAVPASPPVDAIDPPDVPPDVVMEAMKTISPVKDATYAANWAYWEQNKARAKQHPEAFAEEILYGTSRWEPPTKTLNAMALPEPA